MEQRIPQSLPQTELRAKTQRQKQRANSLQKQGRFQDKTRHADDPAYLGRRNGLLHNPALFQADFSTRKHKNRYRHSDHSHAADLNQQQKDHLPKGRPIQGRVMDHQPGDAGGRRGGEQRVQKRCAAGATGGAGKHQQQRPAQD